jgi:group II intron reverse transcriptase/maturase
VLFKSLWKRLLRVGDRVVIEGVAEEARDDGGPVVVVSVRLRRRRSKRGFCGRCARLSPGHDAGAGRRRWRSLDQGMTRTYIEAQAPRVACKVHGPRVAEVPWARHDVGFTRDFDDQVAWLAVHSCDRATLVVAWHRVIGNRGARTAGVDHVTREVAQRRGREAFLEDLRSSLKDGTFRPLPVRQTSIPKRGGKVRYLGIPTLRDRVAQMALKLVLEPIFEADFYPSSYGYRPGRRAQDAIAEIHHFCKPSTYEWVIEGDIKACFDTVDHQLLMELVAQRIGDRKVLRLVRAFLRAGVIEQHGGFAARLTGTPQGGIVSPLLANIYLSVIDRHFQQAWEVEMSPRWRRQKRRQKGLPNYRLVRYADLCGHPHRSAYAEVRIMPTMPVNLQVRAVSVAGCSA